MMQETTILSATGQHADDLPISREHDVFLDEDSRIHLTHLKVQNIINSAMLKYEKDALW